MTVPTGEGHKCGLDAADEPGTPLPGYRPDRARANQAAYGHLDYDAKPKDASDDAVVDMTAKPVT